MIARPRAAAEVVAVVAIVMKEAAVVEAAEEVSISYNNTVITLLAETKFRWMLQLWKVGPLRPRMH